MVSNQVGDNRVRNLQHSSGLGELERPLYSTVDLLMARFLESFNSQNQHLEPAYSEQNSKKENYLRWNCDKDVKLQKMRRSEKNARRAIGFTIPRRRSSCRRRGRGASEQRGTPPWEGWMNREIWDRDEERETVS